MLTIGAFSRVTHLSVKTLRHYHDVGLLEPAEVDPWSGYRHYGLDQVPTAQVIRRFRDLGMPVEEVKSVLAAPDLDERNRLIAAHLRRMEDQLAATQAAVASLRALVERPLTAAIEHRRDPAVAALAISEHVARGEMAEWFYAAFDEIEASGVEPAGPRGGMYAQSIFEDDAGVATVYVPVRGEPAGSGRVQPFVVPAADLAVIVFDGPHEDADRAYGALGTHVAERAIGIEGPVRERYLADERTEIAWPIFRTAS